MALDAINYFLLSGRTRLYNLEIISKIKKYSLSFKNYCLRLEEYRALNMSNAALSNIMFCKFTELASNWVSPENWALERQ